MSATGATTVELVRRAPSPLGADCIAARDVFSLELERLDLLIRRELPKVRARYELTQDEWRGLYVSDAQVEALLRSADAAGASDVLTTRADTLLQRLGARPEFETTPWSHLQRSLGLTRLECDLVLAALAAEFDPKYENLFAYLNNSVTRKWVCGDLAGRLFARHPVDRAALREMIAPESRLAGIGLIEMEPGSRDLPAMQRGLRVASPLVRWLLGLPYVDERAAGILEWNGEPPMPAATPHEAHLRRWAERIRLRTSDRYLVTSSSEEEAAAAAARMLEIAGMPCIRLDLQAMRMSAAPGEVLTATLLMARVFDAGVVATPLEALVDGEGRVLEPCLASVRRLFAELPVSLWCGTRRAQPVPLFGRPQAETFTSVEVPDITAQARSDVWRATLGAHAVRFDTAFLGDRFNFGAARIARVQRQASARARRAGPSDFTQADLLDVARAICTEQSGSTTSVLTTPFSWDDLVLPASVKRQLLDFVRSIELRPRVLDEWGLASRLGNARNSTLLLKGVSGGGKSLSARIIAKKLDLELHRIDLANVVSKYIGETEKNLDRAFDAARRANAVLFIDEADALFGKRSEVKDAHDRYANVETAYLLQKIEDHDGVVILATNLANNIDEAFQRRIQNVVEIPMPDASARERLWRNMLSERTPLAADVDLAFLARQFAFAGGDIRNMVLDAAYLAAQETDAIHMRHLLAAVARQYAKRGKVPTASEFREYFGMLSKGGST